MNRIAQALSAVRWSLAAGAAALGIVGAWDLVPRWVAIGLVLFFLPIVTQLIPVAVVRIAGAWLGAFLLLQVLVTLIMSSDFKTLPPNMVKYLEIRGDVVPGFQGVQKVTTDRNGFRVTKAVNYRDKPARTVRIFAIGGSTTEQLLLDDRKTWTHLLQDHLQATWTDPSVEVVNTGVSGLRAQHHLATLRVVSKYDPDVALFLVGINDWNKQIKEAYGSTTYRDQQMYELLDLMRFANTPLASMIRMLKGKLFPNGLNATAGLEVFDGEYYSKQNNSLDRKETREPGIIKVASDYSATMARIAVECKRQGIVCVFITQPTAYRQYAMEGIKRRFWMTPFNETYTLTLQSMENIAGLYNRYLLDIASQHGLLACDVSAQLPPTIDVFYDDCHFNEEGARRFAKQLADCLTTNLSASSFRLGR